LKHVNVTQWVRGRKLSSPTRPKASHQVGSRTEGRSLKGGVRSRGEARTQAASLNSEKCIVVDIRIGPGNRTESRRCAGTGRQQSWQRKGELAGYHRGLRAGHVGKRVIRELGRASRLLGNNSRREGDRHNQHPGDYWPTRPMDEPTPAQAGRNTKTNASTRGTGREPKANRPGRTKAVVATHSTAGQGATSARTRGEPRPKGPTIKAARQREGNAGAWRLCRGKAEGTLSPTTVLTKPVWSAQKSGGRSLPSDGQQQPCRLWSRKPQVLGPKGSLLTNRMSELFKYGSVGGVVRKPGSYPAGNSSGALLFHVQRLGRAVPDLFRWPYRHP